MKIEGHSLLPSEKWWAAVEFEKQSFGRKKYADALDLLAHADERYDLILPDSGKTIARGIFYNNKNLPLLKTLLEAIQNWQSASVYGNGQYFESSELRLFVRLIACAATKAPCRLAVEPENMAFLGCCLPNIGVRLCNYSINKLKKGKKYWFSFFREKQDNPTVFVLNKEALRQSVRVAGLCPFFPEKAVSIIDQLPQTVDLSLKMDTQYWTPVKNRIKSRWLCRFPPIVPCYEGVYNRWIQQTLR